MFSLQLNGRPRTRCYYFNIGGEKQSNSVRVHRVTICASSYSAKKSLCMQKHKSQAPGDKIQQYNKVDKQVIHQNMSNAVDTSEIHMGPFVLLWKEG